ncbi:hypothetical protein DRE_07473 [Drechslerella stenobrocha 248]|uniref:Uncharacterized protein n=1 Tax=Drechslerella stenobrocha 248 TaxID=1043628 RepID=W7HIK6_9PEZI|nr:hypothetical protein DRE_07473 [Drechslerella stenobrocha 248]
MEPILEEDEPIEGQVRPQARPRPRQQRHPPHLHSVCVSPAAPIANLEPTAETTPVKTPKRRVFDPYAFTPSKLIPRDKYTDQPSLRKWGSKAPPGCNYAACLPQEIEDYSASHQQRPNLARSQSTTGVEVEAELSRSDSKKKSRTGFPRSLFSFKSAATESNSSGASNSESENTKVGSPGRKLSIRRRLLRAKTLPVENHSPDRASLHALGLRPPSGWSEPDIPEIPPPKPFETRLCDGCCRSITMAPKQYACSDPGCTKRLCDRCYRMSQDSKDQGCEISTETLQKAHTAAEFRERLTKGILSDRKIPLQDKKNHVGAAASYAAGYPIVHENVTYDIEAKTDPARVQHLDLTRLEDFFGKQEVWMTLRAASATEGPNIIADEDGDFMLFENLSTESIDACWGWSYAVEKRGAAETGRTAPALPSVDLQPPTFPVSTSPARTIVSTLSRSDSSATDTDTDTDTDSSPTASTLTL